MGPSCRPLSSQSLENPRIFWEVADRHLWRCGIDKLLTVSSEFPWSMVARAEPKPVPACLARSEKKTMNSEKREAAAQASTEQAESTFLRVWTSRETEKQDTAEYLGCSCSINTAL